MVLMSSVRLNVFLKVETFRDVIFLPFPIVFLCKSAKRKKIQC